MNVFKTSDMYLVAYLMAKDHKVECTVRIKKRCTFHIADTKSCREDVKAYYNNGSVGVSAFKNALQSIRGMIKDTAVHNRESWTNYEDATDGSQSS